MRGLTLQDVLYVMTFVGGTIAFACALIGHVWGIFNVGGRLAGLVHGQQLGRMAISEIPKRKLVPHLLLIVAYPALFLSVSALLAISGYFELFLIVVSTFIFIHGVIGWWLIIHSKECLLLKVLMTAGHIVAAYYLGLVILSSAGH